MEKQVENTDIFFEPWLRMFSLEKMDFYSSFWKFNFIILAQNNLQLLNIKM